MIVDYIQLLIHNKEVSISVTVWNFNEDYSWD
jgi:hypothetical protein